jgi:hypothetical protein
VERRRRSERKPSTRLKRPPKASSPWPHIEELISYDGNISIGRVHPIACAAVASDKHNMLAVLLRRANESFLELPRPARSGDRPDPELRSMLTAHA